MSKRPDVYEITSHICDTAGKRLNRDGFQAILCAVINRNALDRVAEALDRNTAALQAGKAKRK